ncbi:MAG: DUF4340 domain-containing protein [Pseudomonadota bacterium]
MIRLLSLMLLLQAGLVAFLYWPEGEEQVSGALISGFAFDNIDRIEVTDAEGGSVVLNLDDGAWNLAGGLPADSEKVSALTDALARDPGLAIATSESAARRFKLSDDDFERRVLLGAGSVERTAYLGTSPTFRKIHARGEGDANIYMIALNSYDAPVETGPWLDKTLLAQRDLGAFELYDLRFVREGEGWRRDDGESVDDEAMTQLLQVLEGLRVSGLVADDDEDASAAGEALRISLGSGPDTQQLLVLDNPEIERYYLSSDRFAPLFDTSAYDAERLIEAAKALVGITEEPSELEEAPEDEEQDAVEASASS